ncbi:MAG TPA: ATP-binding protein [Gemmatimonadaceae bacterium]|nr:ATP-binding protein [Gemmatimonadaceae bacterium]
MTSRRWTVWGLAFAALGIAALALYTVRSQLGEAHVALVFLLVVLGASAAGGRMLGVSTSIVAFVLFDWLFLPPYKTLLVRNPFDWLVLIAFLITSVVAAQLLYQARSERAAVERAEALREADKLKDALLASVSHDLRTPLTAIKGLAHELQALGDERTLMIEEQADRLNRLVTDLLDIARLNGGALPLDIQINAVDDLLGAVQQHIAARPDADRLTISLDDPASISFGLFDYVHTLRIVANLTDNAFKHTAPGTPIELTGGVQGNAVVFRVSDRGPGFPFPPSDQVFLPYQRHSTDPGTDSTGLGLWIARRLADAQGGTLTYRNRDGGGVTFELRLRVTTP